MRPVSGFGRAGLAFGDDGEDGGDGILSNSTGLGCADSVVFSKSTLGTPEDANPARR